VSRAFAVPDRARRRFLTRAAALGGLALAGPDAWLARLAAQAPCTGGPEGELVRVLPFSAPGARETPLGEMVGGAGLDARLFTDLSTLGAGALVTPTAQVYVRTAAPSRLPRDAAAWTIALGPGTGGSGPSVGAAALAGDAQPMGAHVMECAGNSNPQNFGLMSAVEWDGVLLSRVLARLSRPAGATAVMVTGLDDEASGSQASQPGASWVFPVEAVDRLAPFLAVRMNGQPLTPDHGAPVRLVVPGWYGCAWIKWITRIEWVAADAPATSQMREFAGRTHQDGVPALARDYAPPAIDTAAMPVRVEQRRVDGKIEYRVVGIVWGGTQPVDRLVIRFGPRDPGEAFAICPAPRTHHTWSLWTYRWRPAEPGYYDIALRAADPTVRTRRLDLSFYVRRVRVDET
jgi:DMSO/TMAO reductase YedYZ molybdopterin-dependent catalytic subunit